MKRQIFQKLKELKNKNDLENSSKTTNNFNQLENTNKQYTYNPNPNGKQYNENNKENSFNSNSKRGKMGKLEYAIEPRNILLIPDNVNIKNTNLKICEKELLPKEKNYFISDTNFQLIKNALNEKENTINKLKSALENKNKEILLLEKGNKKLEEANNELILQIQKNNIYFNKMYQLLKYVFNYYNSFNDPKIKKFIKEQNLESILNKKNISSKNENQNNNNNSDNTYKDNSINYLFDINNDSIIKELEKYKKMYNDIRKELNYITNLKSKEKENQDDDIKKILENQKKINELKLENQNYMKENTYLKLLCKNIALEKKISDIDGNSEVVEQLEKKFEKEKSKNDNLNKENEILKNKIESQLNELNSLKLTMNKMNQEMQLKNLELEKIKLELEKLKQKINDGNSLKSNEELKNKNNVYSRKMNLEMNTINRTKFKKLKIENTQNLFYPTEKNELKLEGQNNEILTQINNVDLLMLLYNKSKLNETYIQNK
jgi:hypothetical protein